jgi:hypothetical protein
MRALVCVSILGFSARGMIVSENESILLHSLRLAGGRESAKGLNLACNCASERKQQLTPHQQPAPYRLTFSARREQRGLAKRWSAKTPAAFYSRLLTATTAAIQFCIKSIKSGMLHS